MFASAPLHSTQSRGWGLAFSIPPVSFSGPYRPATFITAATNSSSRSTYLGNIGAQSSSSINQAPAKFTVWTALKGLQTSATCRAEPDDQTSSQAASSTLDASGGSQTTSQEGASVESVSGPDSPSPSTASINGNGSQSGQLLFKAGAAMIPHPEKAYRGGEDAYFIGDDGLSLGVADGVGGWAEVNVDPGIYSRLLMRNCKQAAKDLGSSADRPKEILIKAHSQTDQKGSSTACVITLEGDTLKAANVGDSGFLVMRDEKIVMRSPAQQHQFNFPYQIGGPDCGSDAPQAAESFAFALQRGDVVVLATDGVTDNVFPEEAAAIVSVIKRKGETSQVAATGLAQYASMRADSKTHMTPFAVGAQQAGFFFQGGKLDDITVLVAYVTDASSI